MHLSGICSEIVESRIEQESIVATTRGTDIAVHDLFFNVPARKKFLKTKETEWRAIAHLYQALCLTYQDVSFKLYHDDRLIYNIPVVSSFLDRLAQLFDTMLTKNCLSIQSNQEHMKVSISGAITESSYARFDRSQIFMFVNKRWIKNHKLVQALIKGYQGMLPTQRYPAGFIFITLDPLFVDINIHPRKEEVQFLHPRIIEELIQTTVREKLEEKHALQLGAQKSSPIKEPARLYNEPPAHTLGIHNPLTFSYDDEQKKSFLEILDATTFTQVRTNDNEYGAFQIQNTDHNRSITQDQAAPAPLNYRLIGQLHATYVLVETEDGLVLMDQHAAHERIIYERLRTHFDTIARVKLLFPQIIALSHADITLFEPYLEMLTDFGIEVQRLGDHEIAILETPVFLKNQSLDDLIKQAISVLHEYQYLEHAELKKIMHERVHASVSCKAAVKAGDELSIESMHELIKDLYASNNKLTCPHGRPTIWHVKSSEIQKKFKRDYR